MMVLEGRRGMRMEGLLKLYVTSVTGFVTS
jgi:hypothetical protein